MSINIAKQKIFQLKTTIHSNISFCCKIVNGKFGFIVFVCWIIAFYCFFLLKRIYSIFPNCFNLELQYRKIELCKLIRSCQEFKHTLVHVKCGKKYKWIKWHELYMHSFQNHPLMIFHFLFAGYKYNKGS